MNEKIKEQDKCFCLNNENNFSFSEKNNVNQKFTKNSIEKIKFENKFLYIKKAEIFSYLNNSKEKYFLIEDIISFSLDNQFVKYLLKIFLKYIKYLL